MSNNKLHPLTGTGTADVTSRTIDRTGVDTAVTGLDINASGAEVLSSAGHGTAAAALRVELPTDGTGVIATVGAVTAVTNPVTVAQATAANLNVTEASAAAIAASASVLDDWDESDRAKVNLIVGQAGIAAGTGVDGATVPRVTLATNVALPAGNNNIGDVDVATMPAITGSVTANAGTNLNTSLLALEAGGNLASIATDVGTLLDTVQTLGDDTYVEATNRGIVIGAVRRDADTTLVNTTNEIAPLQVDARGALKVEVFSGGETLPVLDTNSAAALTALQLIDDPVMTLGTTTYTETTTKGNAVAAFRRDADTTMVDTTNEAAPLQVDAIGRLKVFPAPDMLRISVQSGGLTTASTAYSAGDQMGTQFTIANASRASGGYGYITGVLLVSAADIIGPVDVVFTRASVSLASDNVAYAISDGDALNVIGLVPLAGAYDIGNNRIAQAYNLSIPYDCSGGTSIYAGLITRIGHTFFAAATDLQLIVFVERNS